MSGARRTPEEFYGYVFETARQIIRAEDPLQLLAGGAPPTEYDGEAERIALGLLRLHPNRKAVTQHVTSVFNGRFWPGAVPQPVCARVAERLCQALDALRSAPE